MVKIVTYHQDGSITEQEVPDQPKPEFRTLTGSQFITVMVAALGAGRSNNLLRASPLAATAIQKANTIDRHGGNFPGLLAHIMSDDLGADKLTAQELVAIETVWRAA